MKTPRISRFRQLGSPYLCYVYAWYDGGELIYVGAGANSRGLEPHLHSGEGALAAEMRRQASKAFRCEVVEQGLTTMQARRLESWAIKWLRPTYNTRY